MKIFNKYGTRSIEVRRARREFYFRLALVSAVLLFFVGMILVAQFRPRLEESDSNQLPEVGNMGDPMKNPALVRMRGEVADLEASYFARLEQNEIEEAIDDLEEAIRTQRTVIRMRGSEIAPRQDLDKLESLLSLYDEEMGKFLIAQSQRLEDSAQVAYREERYTEAVDLLSRAIRLQNEVNEQYPRSSARSSTRLHRMENTLLNWETRPTAERADALRENAFLLAEEGRYEDARAAMSEALQIQMDLNETNRDSRFASISRLRQFEAAWRDIQAYEDNQRVDELMNLSREALKNGNTVTAVNSATEAETLHRGLVERFPTLMTSAANTRLRQILSIKDTAASYDAFQELSSLYKTVQELLRNQEMGNFKNAVSELLRAAESFLINYANSDFADEVEEEEIRFLHSQREAIPSLLETVYNNLLLIPGTTDQYLFRTEISQVLFERIMGDNPSSVTGGQLPVESVTWTQAVVFTERLTWILSRPVKLPSREQFLAALGTVEADSLSQTAWSSQNTDRQAQPVATKDPNQHGFYDLLGNVAEWLSSNGNFRPESVTAMGGSARDSFIRLERIPDEMRSPTERNRFIGFRPVVLIRE